MVTHSFLYLLGPLTAGNSSFTPLLRASKHYHWYHYRCHSHYPVYTASDIAHATMHFLLTVPFVLLYLQQLMMLKIMHVYIECASITSEQHLVSVSRVCTLVPRLPASGVGSLVLLSLDLAYSFSPHLHNVSVHVPEWGSLGTRP